MIVESLAEDRMVLDAQDANWVSLNHGVPNSVNCNPLIACEAKALIWHLKTNKTVGYIGSGGAKLKRLVSELSLEFEYTS